MHTRMQEQAGKTAEPWQQKETQPSASSKEPVGDYIDFEEVK